MDQSRRMRPGRARAAPPLKARSYRGMICRVTPPASDEPRRLSGWLVIGVPALPVIFAWFTLRRGYSKDVRLGAFLLLGLSVLVGLSA